MGGMKTLLTVLVVMAMLGVLGVLLVGMVGMVRGDQQPERSNRLMRWRVILQGIALALFVLLMMLMRD
jgi:NADH:ubiquinone oxidoreductase subunit 6 (subunit J)